MFLPVAETPESRNIEMRLEIRPWRLRIGCFPLSRSVSMMQRNCNDWRLPNSRALRQTRDRYKLKGNTAADRGPSA